MFQARVVADGEIGSDALAEVRRLVFDAYDGDFSEEDWEHTCGGWRIMVFDGEVPVSHAAVIPRLLEVARRPFQAGYVEAVATSAERRGEGLGALVMRRTAKLIQTRFELGGLSTGVHAFYARFGWERWRGPLFARAGAELLRTPDEDDGLMVLRFGPSARIDLAAPIVCERRSGDDW